MITTKNNFKGYLRKHYPEINAYPVYGLPVYIMDKPLSHMDMYKYNVQQLPSGKYVVFIGTTVEEATQLFIKLQTEGIPSNSRPREHDTAPTTFSSFENWLDRHDIKPINRTFCNNMSPMECFHSECIEGCVDIQKKGVWYMYELPPHIDNGILFKNIPHIVIDDGTKRGDVLVILIKAAASRYKSRKQRFMERFELMQPLYERLIGICAVADQMDQAREYTSAQEKWEEAKHLCEQYMNIQFELENGYIKIDEMKEAYRNGTISLYTRNPGKLYQTDTETF